MRYLSLVFLIILFSCKKTDTDTNIVTPVNPTGITLGTQKQIFGSTVHSWGYRVDANNNRLFFAVKRNSGVDEFYTTDANDSTYQLQPFFSGSLRLDLRNGSFCLKPNGDVFALIDKYNSGASPDSLIAILNKANTNSWQVIKRGIRDASWAGHYCFGCATAPTNIFSTPTGRLVMIGSTKVIVSDDNGLSWRQTFNTPFAGGVYDKAVLTTIGSRNFIGVSDGLLYSDTNFETGSYVLVDNGVFIYRKIIKLDDQRLIMNSSFGLYQSINNGQTWSHYIPKDPSDSLYTYSNSYFAFISGSTFRVRAVYKPCNAYMTVDINPNAFFKFYPLPKQPCPITNLDEIIESCQRPDKRTYYVYSGTIGTAPYLGVYRDY